MNETLTDEQRFPAITAAGRRALEWLHEHPSAPRYTNRCGHRMTAEQLRRVREFEAELNAAQKGWRHGEVPDWLARFAEFCFRDVPFYRRYGAMPHSFFDIPAADRSDLSREPWAFVPDSQSLDDLLLYATSGTTGHPLLVNSNPEVAGRYMPLLQAALAAHGLRMQGGQGRVACLLVCFQKTTFSYAAVHPLLGEAGFAKINLNPADWRDPGDIVRFIDACNPEIFTGDPLSFAELARLPLSARPKALISTAMMLLPGQRQSLENRFGCPVLDLYSMNEAGPIAVSAPGGGGHALLQHRLYVEILDPDGAPCPPGTRGEITLSGGFNFFIPLLRYRTNDFASLEFRDTRPVLVGLEGRPPTTFVTTSGQTLNNVDITIALRDLAIPQYSLHQSADGSLLVRVRGFSDHAKIRAILLRLFGPDQRLTIEDSDALAEGAQKMMQYTRDEG